ncbi:hypothetical protein [Nocardia pseudobrasiliensis]|uniref:Mce-associated membrane protein n=1 Tax=Nocardia pseudobrasiliensis TaxID=45979 RepID=A0A370I7U3_9NOCA|nr:hypothetical protein [Nocardia pseudobrasiliensis]RDI66211.1 Mce-associated membrane protein [Nocardia pseudobrasiliensis]
MSETKDTEGRGRRRAVRSAGPAEGATEVEPIVERSAVTAKFDAPVVEPTVVSEPAVAAIESAAPDAAAGGDGPAKSGRLGALGWAAAVIAVLSALALIGSGGLYIYHDRHANALDTRRADYVQTAKQAVLNLTNIKDDTAQQDIDRVLSVASGQLKEEYASRKDAYAQVVQQAKVRATGEIIDAAIESDDDDTARVLVAAKQTLTNAASADPQQRYYRFRITVGHGDDGHLTASQVEFVP